MKCKCLASVIAKMLAHQVEVADTIAKAHEVTNFTRQRQLAEEARQNQAAFAAFVAEYQITVKKRSGVPTKSTC